MRLAIERTIEHLDFDSPRSMISDTARNYLPRCLLLKFVLPTVVSGQVSPTSFNTLSGQSQGALIL